MLKIHKTFVHSLATIRKERKNLRTYLSKQGRKASIARVKQLEKGEHKWNLRQ